MNFQNLLSGKNEDEDDEIEPLLQDDEYSYDDFMTELQKYPIRSEPNKIMNSSQNEKTTPTIEKKK